MTSENNHYKNCPQCFFQNPITHTHCQLCDWPLLDELDINKTRFVEHHADQTQQADPELTETKFAEDTVFPELDAAFINNSDQDITQAPEPVAKSSESSTHSPKSKFNLTGELAHFEVLEILGQGGMGAVYRAKDKMLERNVALKMLKTKAGTSQAANSMLLDEARMACKLNHPNIVTIFDVARAQNSNFIIMEWVDGQSLDQVIPPTGLPLETALEYASQIIAGIACAHQSNIIHSDIKPQNIMLTLDGTIKVLDFGIAGLICHQKTAGEAKKEDGKEHKKEDKNQNSQQDKTITTMATKGFTGTPGYISPEQALGKKNLDQRSDIFSFGVLLYQMLTGKRPFEGDNGKARNQAIIMGDYAPLPSQLPVDLRAIVDHCLAHAIEDRYQSSRQLSHDLHNYLNGEPVSVISSRRYWLQKKTLKHKWPVLVLLLLSLGSITQLVWQQIQSHQQQEREQLLTRFISHVETLEAKVQMSRMAPRHDTSAETAQWLQQIDTLKQQITTLGDAAYGSGHYAIGRMYYALQQYDLALIHSQQAWQSGFQQPRVAYTLALSHSAIYQRKKGIISNLSSRSARKDRMATLDKQHKQPAINYLNQGMKGSPYQSYAKALLQFYQGEQQQALATLNNSQDLPVWFYQHHLLRGDISLAKAEVASAAHGGNEVAINTQRALQHYAKAAELGRSDLQLQLKPLAVYFRQLTNAVYGNQQNFETTFQQAMGFVDNAMVIAPNHYQPYFIKGRLLSRKSAYQDQHSGQPIASQQQAIEHLQQALNYSANNTDILFSLARAYFQKSKLLQDRDFPVEQAFEHSLNTFERIPKQHRDYFFFNSYASLLQTLAIENGKRQQVLGVKKAPKSSKKQKALSLKPYFEQAINTYQQASQLQPKRIGAQINLATTYLDWSQFVSPVKAQQQLLQAIAQYQQALTLNPQHFVVNYYLGQSYRWLAKINNTLLLDNSFELKQAKFYLAQAEQVQAKHPFVVVERAMLAADIAIYQWQQGLPYQSLLKEAKNSVKQALLLNPDNSLLIDNNAFLYRLVQQLSYFENGFKIDNIESYNKALIETIKSVSYGQEGLFLLQLLNHKWQGIKQTEIDHLPAHIETQLVTAEWYSQNGRYAQAERHFNTIEQYYPSLLWLYHRQHLQRWLNALQQTNTTLADTEKAAHVLQSKQQLKQKLKKQIQVLNQQLGQYYPALVTAT
ncbi:MAG: serine/threonine protein kinase [Cognaticolwellia sp.]|jgi:serine/threonine protein kinase